MAPGVEVVAVDLYHGAERGEGVGITILLLK